MPKAISLSASRISLSPWVEASLNAATLSWKASLALIWKATAFTTLPVLSMIFRWRKARFMRKLIETGAIDLDIEVGWYTGYPDDMESTMPIAVKFTGTRVGDDPAGVEALPVAGDVLINATTGGVTVSGFVGNVEVYTVDGRLAAIVASDGETMVALRSGLYIVRADKTVKKVIVK